MKHLTHLLPLLLLSLGATTASAQTAAGLTQAQTGATVTTLLTESDLVGQFGGSHLDGLELAVMPDGDVLFVGNGPSSLTELYHRDATSGAVTKVVTSAQLQQATGYSITGGKWLDVDGLDVDAAGNAYILLHGWDWLLQGPAELHLLRVPLTSAAPGGFGAPVSIFNKPHGIFGEIAMDMDVTGTLHMVVDDGEPAADVGATPVPNGLDRLVLGQTVPLPVAGYTSIAPILSGGGPTLTGDPLTHEDIGAGNIAAGLFKSYLTMADTSGSALTTDTTGGEPHDGDIVEVDHTTGATKVLIPKQRYLQVTNSLFLMDRPLRTDLRDVTMVVDLQRDRLYTWENDYDWEGPFKHLSLLQWNLTTGAFEGIVLHHEEVVRQWILDGDNPMTSSFLIHNLAPKGNVMCLAPDGSILVYVQAFLADGGDRLLRTTPTDL